MRDFFLGARLVETEHREQVLHFDRAGWWVGANPLKLGVPRGQSAQLIPQLVVLSIRDLRTRLVVVEVRVVCYLRGEPFDLSLLAAFAGPLRYHGMRSAATALNLRFRSP